MPKDSNQGFNENEKGILNDQIRRLLTFKGIVGETMKVEAKMSQVTNDVMGFVRVGEDDDAVELRLSRVDGIVDLVLT